jgi:hypothetical protein
MIYISAFSFPNIQTLDNWRLWSQKESSGIYGYLDSNGKLFKFLFD